MDGICSLFELCNPQMLSDYTLSRLTAKFKKQNVSSHEELVHFVSHNLSPKPQRNYRDNRIGKRLKEKQSKRKLNCKRSHDNTQTSDHSSSKYTRIDHNTSSNRSTVSTSSTSPRYSTISSKSSSSTTTTTKSSKSPTSSNGSNSAEKDGVESPTKRNKISWP